MQVHTSSRKEEKYKTKAVSLARISFYLIKDLETINNYFTALYFYNVKIIIKNSGVPTDTI